MFNAPKSKNPPHHPSALLSRYKHLWELTEFETKKMAVFWKERHDTVIRRPGKSKEAFKIIISEAHTSTLVLAASSTDAEIDEQYEPRSESEEEDEPEVQNGRSEEQSTQTPEIHIPNNPTSVPAIVSPTASIFDDAARSSPRRFHPISSSRHPTRESAHGTQFTAHGSAELDETGEMVLQTALCAGACVQLIAGCPRPRYDRLLSLRPPASKLEELWYY
ncbi:hypothetical protein HYPSUDRAFT_208348 [Hypholoma sublateritium FD-334 SS-4]|uniref:Uncharacterized protein n=1 Tax=Hypholoma sublateritium (strain FD-334 SS-4) TaxID=945553 RepID=A0A0D2KJS0_HYPSF|nr:hypothetical protein HYPSUDRAFT_208348 [Hypholoma sublateritium FD-334 SS-4]